MKILYCLCAAALLGTFASAAKADQSDFRLQVLDPFAGDSSVISTSITSTASFSITFGNPYDSTDSNCPVAEGPYADDTFCFVGLNGSGQTFNSLTFTVPNNALLDGQPVGCDDNELGKDEFTSPAVCTPPSAGDDDYTVYFTGGNGIADGDYFVIAETGADPSAFVGNTVTPGVTPEPASIWMVSSAAAMLGLLLFGRRRSIHGSLL